MQIKKLQVPRCFSKKVIGSALVGLLFLSPLQADTLSGETTEVESSEDQLIAALAREHGLAAEHLAWANSLAPTASVKSGKKLTKPARLLPSNPPDEGIVGNLAERGGYVYDDGEFVEFVPFSIGREEKDSYHSPSGDFKVISRVKNPVWTAPESDWAEAMEKDRISADSKANPLGEYWFGFDAPTGGYGFHENTAPDYTGDTVSHGCLRLYPEDARMLYDKKLLQPGDTVRIVNEPIRISQNEDGETYLAVFPGVYERTDLQKILTKELIDLSLSDFFDEEKIEEMTSDPTGVPQLLLERDVTLKKDGSALTKEKFKALHVDGKVIMPTAALEEFDIQVGYSSEEDEVTLQKGEKKLSFPVSGSGDVTSYRLGDQSYVNASDVLKSFELPYMWNGQDKTLDIEESI
jgi:L,D-transpeptidase ErfK/SrfK